MPLKRNCAACVKAHWQAPVVMGGSHVSAVPETVLAHPDVDFVIRGEGERPLVELLRCLQGRQGLADVPNLGYKHAGQLRFNVIEDNYAIDALPFPDLSDAPPARYDLGGKPLTFMITSRSCPHKCSFCSVHTTFGDNYRRRAIETLPAEIEQRYHEGYRVIDFEDDNLTFYKSAFKELCRRLIARFPQRQMEFVAMNGISYLSLDDEMLDLMRQAGFSRLNLALWVADKSPFSTFHQYYHFGQPFAAIAAEVAALQPDLVGISSLFTPYYREALEVATRVKVHWQAPVVMGGSHVSAVPETVLAHPDVDFVIRGEGERPLVELLRCLQGRQGLADVPNLGYKHAGQLRFNGIEDNYAIDAIET